MKQRMWEKSVMDLKDRLRKRYVWFPFPAFISFALLLLLDSQILMSLNPRLGNPISPISISGDPALEGAIWISLSLSDSFVVATTGDRKVFRWHQDVKSLKDMETLTDYLKFRRNALIESVSLAKKTSLAEATVIIAADETLRFGHIRPLIYAIAHSGIGHYAFEGKLALAKSH